MLIIFDEQTKQLKVLRNTEYRKWLQHIDRINMIATKENANPFEQNPVKWESVDFSDIKKTKIFENFKNTINSVVNNDKK